MVVMKEMIVDKYIMSLDILKYEGFPPAAAGRCVRPSCSTDSAAGK